MNYFFNQEFIFFIRYFGIFYQVFIFIRYFSIFGQPWIYNLFILCFRASASHLQRTRTIFFHHLMHISGLQGFFSLVLSTGEQPQLGTRCKVGLAFNGIKLSVACYLVTVTHSQPNQQPDLQSDRHFSPHIKNAEAITGEGVSWSFSVA